MEESYGTLSETINSLKKEGYTLDFNVAGECIMCHQPLIKLSPAEFKIDKVYRFEGDSNPSDESIVYAISTLKSDVKGTLVNAYGIYSDEASDALVEKLKQHY